MRVAEILSGYALDKSHPELTDAYKVDCDALEKEVQKKMKQAVGVYFGTLDVIDGSLIE